MLLILTMLGMKITMMMMQAVEKAGLGMDMWWALDPSVESRAMEGRCSSAPSSPRQHSALQLHTRCSPRQYSALVENNYVQDAHLGDTLLLQYKYQLQSTALI